MLIEEQKANAIINGAGPRINSLCADTTKKNNHLMLRFCQEREVNKKRQKSHKEKTAFLCKFKHLKHLGVRQRLHGRVDGWIDENIKKDHLTFKE